MHLRQGEAYNKALKKYQEVGLLGITAEDHQIMGSAPLEKMAANPKKTMAELMDDEELLVFLRQQQEDIEKYSAEEDQKSRAIQDFLRIKKRNLEFSIKYLKEIGRLPKEFSELALS